MSVSGSVKMLKSSGCNLSDSGSTRSTKFRFLSWSPETYPLREFINMFPLPRVVRITNSEDAALLKALILPADVDITQPLLLYKKYRTVKVMGKCLKIQKNGKLKENGPCVVIPDSFPGKTHNLLWSLFSSWVHLWSLSGLLICILRVYTLIFMRAANKLMCQCLLPRDLPLWLKIVESCFNGNYHC